MNRSILLASALTVLATGWVLSGELNDTQPEASAAPTQNNAPRLAKVKATDLQARLVADTLKLQGQIEAAREVELKAEVQGKVVRLPTEKGQRVAAGDTLIELDLNDRMARLEQARAELALREADLQANESLMQKKLISNNQLKQAQAQRAAARADVTQIDVEIANTHIRAPFAGILDQRSVELGDYLSSGDPVAVLVDDSHLLLTADVPQQHIDRIQPGMAVEATLLNRTKLSGVVTYLAKNANAETRTYRMEARVNKPAKGVYFGQSAALAIHLANEKAHLISPAILDLAVDGSLQVKAIDEAQTVRVMPVSILRSDIEGLWVKGLPEQVRLITVGQGFVTDGQQVEATLYHETNDKQPGA